MERALSNTILERVELSFRALAISRENGFYMASKILLMPPEPLWDYLAVELTFDHMVFYKTY